MDILRPFVWLAVSAFLVGFGGYLAVGAGTDAVARTEAPALQADHAWAPTSAEWNRPKPI